MYEPHADLSTPRDDARIWRYMEVGKLVSLLSSAMLYFCRLDLLRDPYEGLPNSFTRDEWKYSEVRPGEMERLFAASRLWTYANSWHVNEYESAAMWDSYLKTAEGIALETTFGRLRDSFAAEQSHQIFIGMVKYIDYETTAVHGNNGFQMAVHKRKSFEHEQELRALVWLLINKGTDLSASPPDGVNVRVDVPCLIRKVYVSPSAGSWFVDVVAALLDKFGCGAIPVIQSRLYSLK
jgi:hypothetical protein